METLNGSWCTLNRRPTGRPFLGDHFSFTRSSHKLCPPVSLSYWRGETSEKMFGKEWVVAVESDRQRDPWNGIQQGRKGIKTVLESGSILRRAGCPCIGDPKGM